MSPGAVRPPRPAVGASAADACSTCGAPTSRAPTRVGRPAGPPALDAAAHMLEDAVPVPLPQGHSGDLPAARETIPRPAARPARPAVTRPIAPTTLPDDLLASRDESLPDNLVASRDALPPLDDLLMPDAGRGRGARGASPGRGGQSQMPSLDLASAGPPLAPAGLDLFLGELPAATESPLAPLDLEADDPGLALTPLDLHDGGTDPGLSQLSFDGGAGGSPLPSLDFGLDEPPPAAGLPGDGGDLTLDLDGAGGAAAPVDIGSMFDSMLGDGPGPSASPPAKPVAAPAPAARQRPAAPATPPRSPARPAPQQPSFLTPAPAPAPQAPAAPAPRFPAPAAPAPADDAEFSLTLEGGPTQGGFEDTPRPAIPLPAKVAAPAPAAGEPLPAGVSRLAPPRRKAEISGPIAVPRSRRTIVMAAAGAGLLVVLAAGAVLVLPRLRGGTAPAQVVAAMAGDLARDHFPAYQRAADALRDAGGADKQPALMAAAAELTLLAHLGRGAERSKIAQAEQLLEGVQAGSEPPPELGRARALLAVARGRGSELDALLGAQTGTPEGQLIAGLRRLRERKPDAAVGPLKAAVAARPGHVLAQYLLARALDAGGKVTEARAGYRKVLADNAEHAGALAAMLRLESGKPAQRRTAAQALLARIASNGSPGETAEVQIVLGEANLALGRSSEAVDLLSRAVATTPTSAVGQRALAEALIADGRAAEALGRLQTADPALLVSMDGRLAMGAALIANGQVSEGSAQIDAAAAQASADNPRLPYWSAVAAEGARPPRLDAAEAGYRKALALDPAFLPASLKLAALLRKRGKPDASLAQIKDAEKAGVPPEALELAWGQALIEARNPAEAETVFRRAVGRAPGLAAARVGLATALEAAGKPAEAQAELERAITDLKGASGLRERLADLLMRRGNKSAALAQLEAELAAGNKTKTLRVAVAKLALDLGQRERAIQELEPMVADDPAVPEALYTLGRVREANGDTAGATRDYKRALAFEAYPDLHLAYGRVLAMAGRDDEALAQLANAGERASPRMERARIHLRRSELDKALAEAEAAARLEPGNAQVQFVRGLCLDLVGRGDDAAAAWRLALQADGKLAEAHYRLGRHEMDKGRQKIALPHFRSAAAGEPLSGSWRADLYFQLGFAEAAAGARSNAVAALKRYLELAPSDAPARPEAEKLLGRLGG
jgi:cellulose synthase operon protein C